MSVHARSEGRGQEGVVVVGQGVGNDHTTPMELAEERRREGHDDARCRKAAGKSGTDEEANEEEEEEEEKKEEERVPRRRDGGEEKERGVRRGELPATRSPSIPRWNRRYVPSALYPHGTLAAPFLSFSPLRPPSPFRANFPVQRVTYMHVHTATMHAYTRARTSTCEAHA